MSNRAPEPGKIRPKPNRVAVLFPAVCGLWLGLALLKFGNPVLLADKIDAPSSYFQFLIDPWPIAWGYGIVAMAAILGLLLWRWPAFRDGRRWMVTLPAIWFLIQVLAWFGSVDSALSSRTLLHFASVAIAFYVGLCAFSNAADLRWFWFLFLAAFCLVVMTGCYQHFIGLEETRRFFFAYELPKYPNGPPPELLKKLASNRIYSTLFYPNTLAAALILATPLLIAQLALVRATRPAKGLLLFLAGAGCLLCLYWSGSKAGWLIALAISVIALSHARVSWRPKLLFLGIVCLTGVVGFVWRYSSYLERGASSATARMDYWRAAVRAFAERPLLGSGPGTFMVSYRRLKPPQAEMARLAHNDYLQQASDSGVVGFVAFSLFIAGSILVLYRRSCSDPVRFAVWLALVGLSLHSLFEFNLYVPAIAWPQFFLFGWLWANGPIASAKSVRAP